MPHLFDPFTHRSVTLRNRIVVSPMCQYAADADGHLGDWHFVHLGSRAVGGAGLVLVEATSVEARGRLSLGDSGIWSDAHVAPLARIVKFGKQAGATMGIQLAHGGRKAWSGGGAGTPSAERPDARGVGKGFGPEPNVGPTGAPFDSDWRPPAPLSEAEIQGIVRAFRDGAARAREAGFEVLEIHAAHGYLLHSFLSPLTNDRTDGYGGDADGRARFFREVVRAVREVWPAELPLWVRFSCSDWAPGGIDVAALAAAVRPVKDLVDVIDCSSGALLPRVKIPVAPGYQVPFATEMREASGIATCAVGLITEPAQADAIVREGRADLVAVGREALRDPYFPLSAARALGVDVPYWPGSYLRAK